MHFACLSYFLGLSDNLKNILRRLRKPISRKSNMNVLAFAFFLFLSSIFWFSLAINKKYVETISYPLKFENPPPRRILVGELPERLHLTIETTGLEIIRYKLRSTIDPINIDLATFYTKQLSKRDSTKFYIVTNLEKSLISAQFKNNPEIRDIKPDTLYFRFDYLKIKKVPVIPDIELSFEQQYMLVGKPAITPDSIVISGPASVIDTLFSIPTKREQLHGINSPVDLNISLIKIPGTDTEKRKVRLVADVDKFTEAKITVPVFPKNTPDSIQLKIFPSSVMMSYHVPFKLFDEITAEDFQFTVNFNDISQSSDKLKISLDRKPENVTIMGWEPKNVEFIIER